MAADHIAAQTTRHFFFGKLHKNMDKAEQNAGQHSVTILVCLHLCVRVCMCSSVCMFKVCVSVTMFVKIIFETSAYVCVSLPLPVYVFL